MPRKKGGTSYGKIFLVLVILAVGGYVAYHDGLFGVTSIRDISSSMADQEIRIKGRVVEVQSSADLFRISDGSASIWVHWELDLPHINDTVVVSGVVQTQNIIITLLWIDAKSITPVWIFK